MIIRTLPFKLDGFTNNPNYVYGYCKCPLDISFGIVVNMDDVKKQQPEAINRGYIEVECDNCHTVMNLYFKKEV